MIMARDIMWGPMGRKRLKIVYPYGQNWSKSNCILVMVENNNGKRSFENFMIYVKCLRLIWNLDTVWYKFDNFPINGRSCTKLRKKTTPDNSVLSNSDHVA